MPAALGKTAGPESTMRMNLTSQNDVCPPPLRVRAGRVVLLSAVVLLATAGVNEAYGYVGPGAGIALLGSFFTVFIAIASAVLALFTWPIRWGWRAIRGKNAYKRAKVKRFVVLGLDGLEPSLAERFMEEGHLPNLTKLCEQGDYKRLATTCPPLSPVAWSSFSTGVNPGKHNIFDFLARNPRTYKPMLSSVHITSSKRTLKLGKYEIPLGKPSIQGMRKSKTFWSVLGEHGVFSSIIRIPITFPPEKFNGVVLSAMCVPDLRGTQGMFSYYTTAKADKQIDKEGGERIEAARNNGHFESYLQGPDNFLLNDGTTMKIPFKVVPKGDGAADLVLNGDTISLEVGKYTPWVDVTFKPGIGMKLRGIARFWLKQLSPELELYVTPLQIDPEKPAMPISHPLVFSQYLSKLSGKYATAGLAEDTWGLSEEVLDEDAFLEQSYAIHDEREKMFFDALSRVKRGTVACCFDGPDRIQHMLWRCMDCICSKCQHVNPQDAKTCAKCGATYETHPAALKMDTSRHRNAIRDMYIRMDDLVGRTMQQVDDESVLFVMSDHGFNPFRCGVDLNAWLEQNGYLVTLPDSKPGSYLSAIDWSKTRAYAVGLAGLFINLKDREENGIVTEEEEEPLKKEIAAKLEQLVDPKTGERVINKVYNCKEAYRGPYIHAAFDLTVGYCRGYRVSWESATGKVTDQILHENVKAWSGDHCIDPVLIPGVLFSNRKLKTETPDIRDVGPTALELFGVPKPAYMEGSSLL